MFEEIYKLMEHNFHQNRLPSFGSQFSGIVDGEHVEGKVVAVEHLGWDSFATIEKDDGTWVSYRGED